MTMKLYKFRSLSEKGSLKRVTTIIKTGEFWCSPLWDQNDPMEAVYIDWRESEKDLPDLFEEKNKYQICSFSSEEALVNPLMWGYYADGFKGVAIEIDATVGGDDGAREVDYVPESPGVDGGENEICKVLTTKLEAWTHEKEYRFLHERGRGPRKFGKITAVYFGSPYGFVMNREQVSDASAAIKKYDRRKERLLKISRSMKYKLFSAHATGCGSVSIKEIQ